MPRGIYDRGPKTLKQKRRFKEHSPLNPMGHFKLNADHEAVTRGRTIYLSTRVKPMPGARVLIAGENQRKLGSVIVKGPWKGMPIYSLTLEERATCPTSCHMWRDCYGNAMRWSRRNAHGEGLEAAIEYDMAALERLHPKGFAVRVHVLGDFYSMAYAGYWRTWLEQFTGLHVWGYTARDRASGIGKVIDNINRDFRHRFFIRFSGARRSRGGATVISRLPEGNVIPEGIVCPVETGKTECCGTCALCWSPVVRDNCIVFVRHGADRSKGGRKKRNANA